MAVWRRLCTPPNRCCFLPIISPALLNVFALPLIFIISSLICKCTAELANCNSQEIGVRSGSLLPHPLTCCSYPALLEIEKNFTDLTVQWLFSSDENKREASIHCTRNSQQSPSGFDEASSAVSLGSGASDPLLNASLGADELIEPVKNNVPISDAPLDCKKTLRPDWNIDEKKNMSLVIAKSLLVKDSGEYDCRTRLNGQVLRSFVKIQVRESLPLDIDAPIISPINQENLTFSVKVCWNGSQWPETTYDSVSYYEVRILRSLDNKAVSNSRLLDPKSPLLSRNFNTGLNTPPWPIDGPCCCWEVPSDNLKPFSTYIASYRAVGGDKQYALKSETHFSKGVKFTTPGVPASVTAANLLSLDKGGTSATLFFSVKPVPGEMPVEHELNITVSLPNADKFELSDRIGIPSGRAEVEANKTFYGLKPFTRYVARAYVVNKAGPSEAKALSFITLPGDLDSIKNLQAETLNTTSVLVKFKKPLFNDHLSLPSFDFGYSIAYQLLRADLSSIICPSLEELCSEGSTDSQYDLADCRCYTVDAPPRMFEVQLPVAGLRRNRPYRVSVRQFFKTNQFVPYNILWPDAIYAPWTTLYGKPYVYTESVAVTTPPILRNVSLSVLVDNSTSFILSFSIAVELTIRQYEEIWAVFFQCGNWSKVVSTRYFANSHRKYGTFDEEMTFKLVHGDDFFPPNKCWFSACPLTRSRLDSLHAGSRGPCSDQKIFVLLPEREEAFALDLEQTQRQNTMKALIGTAVAAVAVVCIIGAIVLLLKRRNWLCLGRKLGRSSAAGANQRHTETVQLSPSPSTDMQLLARMSSSSRQQQQHQQRRLSSISGSDGPLAGSMFCYKVASSSYADFAQEFNAVCSVANSEARKMQYSLKHAEQQANIGKNRYTNVLPYDHSRVTLMDVAIDVPGSDYINANFIGGSDPGFLPYIAAQGPLPWTVPDFWQMIWERKVAKVVMLTDLVESPHESVRKCAAYWPKNIAQAALYKNYRVILMRQRQRPFWIERVFELSRLSDDNPTDEDTNERQRLVDDAGHNSARLVMHFQFTDWPDHGVPSAALPLLRFTQKVIADSCGSSLTTSGDGSTSPPIVVHCSAGIGRSGVFMVLCNEIQRLTSKCQLDPAGCLVLMRRCRPGLVQTSEQFRFIYLALYEAVRAQEVGDHSGLGVPTEPNRLKAWIKFDAETGSKLCDWATSRVPQMQNSNNNFSSSSLLHPGGGGGGDEFSSFGGGGGSYHLSDESINSMSVSSYHLPGPLHSRQVAIFMAAEAGFIAQRLKIWAMSTDNSSNTGSSSSLSGVHLVLISGGNDATIAGNRNEMAEYFRANFPRVGVTCISSASWPPSDPSRIFSTILPSLVITSSSPSLSSAAVASDRPLSPASAIDGGVIDLHSSLPLSESRHPTVVIAIPPRTSQSDLTCLSIAAELAIALECLGEARLTFNVDADPDPDGHVDLLLFARVAALTLPQGALTRSGLQRALSLVAAASSITNNNNSSSSHNATSNSRTSIYSGSSSATSPAVVIASTTGGAGTHFSNAV